MTEAFDFPSLELPCGNHMAELALLPPCRRLKNTIITALDSALTCKECIDWDELWPQIEALHAQDPEDFTPSERSLLGLVYALLALGRRHEEDDTEPSEQGSPGRVIVKGMTYFRASRAIVDSQGYTDLYSILTLCCQAGYLMSCSMMSKAYGLICTGISAALRMGLHVSSSALGDRLSKDDLTRRRRVFAVLNITAVILASVLGLPNLLRDVDGSQVLPLAEDDLADEGQSYIAANPSSPISATIRSAKLFRILVSIRFDEHWAVPWLTEYRRALPKVGLPPATLPQLHPAPTSSIMTRSRDLRPSLQAGTTTSLQCHQPRMTARCSARN